jgi:hypothetical protein
LFDLILFDFFDKNLLSRWSDDTESCLVCQGNIITTYSGGVGFDFGHAGGVAKIILKDLRRQ